MKNEIKKKTQQNDKYSLNNKNLEKNYDNTNNQIIIYQSKVINHWYLVRSIDKSNKVYKWSQKQF